MTSEAVTMDGSVLPMAGQKSIGSGKFRQQIDSPKSPEGEREGGETQLIVEGYSSSKQGGVKIGRLGSGIKTADISPSNLDPAVVHELEP